MPCSAELPYTVTLPPLGASQISTLSNAFYPPGTDFSASQCIDGSWGAGSTVCHTTDATNAWLSVRVGYGSTTSTVAYVASATIYGRSDCCQGDLGHYQIWVGNSPGDPTLTGATQCQPNDYLTVGSPATAGPFTVNCGLSGSYVTLLLPGNNRRLDIAELTVTGRFANTVFDPATTGTCDPQLWVYAQQGGSLSATTEVVYDTTSPVWTPSLDLVLAPGVPTCFEIRDDRPNLAVGTFVPYFNYAGTLQVGGTVGPMTTSGTSVSYSIAIYGVDPACASGVGTAANSCGVHIHENPTCTSDAGGHYYTGSVTSDPWTNINYSPPSATFTSANGGTMVGSYTVDTGAQPANLVGKSVIVHDYSGTRIACAIIASSPGVLLDSGCATLDATSPAPPQLVQLTGGSSLSLTACAFPPSAPLPPAPPPPPEPPAPPPLPPTSCFEDIRAENVREIDEGPNGISDPQLWVYAAPGGFSTPVTVQTEVVPNELDPTWTTDITVQTTQGAPLCFEIRDDEPVSSPHITLNQTPPWAPLNIPKASSRPHLM